ncbi:hypothetical protein [Roseateles chitinivorans]|uniref:hypothetical protein n=1 Tax=Roseateles chitinivorans TaxID=2917965 RepID=UPI003D6791C1
MARATDRRPPRPAPCPAWLGLWLLAGLSTAQAGHADHAETPPPAMPGRRRTALRRQ